MQIVIRLSDYHSAAVEFTAADPSSLKRSCHRAWRQFGALVAQRPGYFEATAEFNKYKTHLADGLTDEARAARIAQWIERGKSPAEIERLWDNLVWSASARLENARARLKNHLAPQSLSIQVRPISGREGPWLTPGNNVLPVWWSPDNETNWTRLWDEVVKIYNHDKNLSSLLDWVVCDVTKPTPNQRRREFSVIDGDRP